MKRFLSIAEIFLITGVALAPLLASFPYRINIFLSWEGAYRMAEGQMPFRDFGMPMGYMYWVIPALFFKIFGAQLITLIKAQAFINLLSGLAFRSIFQRLQVKPEIRFLGVAVFCLSYTFFNYWPWYNHTVIVYELIALAFLFRYLMPTEGKKPAGWAAVTAGAFVFFSFFTKQDGGALAFLLSLALLGYHCWESRRFSGLLLFLAGFFITGAVLIAPSLPYGFGYWFNYGQPPHHSRISIADILREFFAGSQTLKFYLLLILLLLPALWRKTPGYLKNRQQVFMALLTLGMLAEAAIFQVTSYVPVDNNIFYHSFAFVFVLFALDQFVTLSMDRRWALLAITAGVFLWWSSVYWKYMERFILKPETESHTSTKHNGYEYADVINKNTFMIELDTTDIPLSKWRTPALKSFQKILLPGTTVDGIERLMNRPGVKNNPSLKWLNMTELTPLAAELPFALEKGPDYPLWFHKGVASFDKETDMFVRRIQSSYYDIVLYEYIPYLNNFYPYKVREALLQHYELADRFTAPRKPTTDAWIEVFVKRKAQ
jgi:hypothetical protein